MHSETRPLWQTLRHYIEQACHMFGMPNIIALKLWITRDHARHIAHMLAPLEALLRRLIFLEALTLTPEPAPQHETKTRAARSMGAPAGAVFHPENSETWRAPFRVEIAHGASRKTAPKPAPWINCVSSAPAALRLEALIRAYNTYETLALALARKLHANAQRTLLAMLAPPTRTLARHPLAPPLLRAVNLCRQIIAGATPCADTR